MTSAPMRKGRLSDSARAALVGRYQAGETTPAIAKTLGVSRSTIIWTLKQYGISRRRRGSGRNYRRYLLNESAFDAVTPETSYWVGLLMADGCVYAERYGYRIYLTLHQRDTAHLEAYKRFLGTDAPIAIGKDRCARVSVSSRRIAERLISFGVVPAKSYVAEARGLENDRDFWRGVIDGDAHIRVRDDGYPVVYLVGSRPLMTQFHAFVKSVVPETAVQVKPHRSIARLVMSGSPARLVVDALYRDSSPSLPRKRVVAERIMKCGSV